MLALSIGMNDFPYASLLERSNPVSKKVFHQQESQQLQLSLRASQINTSSVPGGHMEWKPEHFPHKMYDLLDDVERKGLDDIVSWLPDGKSFKIHSQIGFEQSIMPLYFSGMSSYKSFRRQLNLYGIYQHRHRPNQDANAYSHELLIRGQRHLCDKIARKKTNPPNKNKPKANCNADKSNSGNKKRGRSSLIAMMDQRNLKNTSPQVGKQNPLVVPSAATSMDIQRSMLMKNFITDEVSTRPNPVNVGKLTKNSNNTFNRTIDNNNVFHSFMGQYWDDLPNNMSSSQVVDEIIATFQQQQQL